MIFWIVEYRAKLVVVDFGNNCPVIFSGITRSQYGYFSN